MIRIRSDLGKLEWRPKKWWIDVLKGPHQFVFLGKGDIGTSGTVVSFGGERGRRASSLFFHLT